MKSSVLRSAFVGFVALTALIFPWVANANGAKYAKDWLSHVCNLAISDTDAAAEFVGKEIRLGFFAPPEAATLSVASLKSLLNEIKRDNGPAIACEDGFDGTFGENIGGVSIAMIHEIRPIILTAHYFKISGEYKIFYLNVLHRPEHLPLRH